MVVDHAPDDVVRKRLGLEKFFVLLLCLNLRPGQVRVEQLHPLDDLDPRPLFNLRASIFGRSDHATLLAVALRPPLDLPAGRQALSAPYRTNTGRTT